MVQQFRKMKQKRPTKNLLVFSTVFYHSLPTILVTNHTAECLEDLNSLSMSLTDASRLSSFGGFGLCFAVAVLTDKWKSQLAIARQSKAEETNSHEKSSVDGCKLYTHYGRAKRNEMKWQPLQRHIRKCTFTHRFF